MYAAFLRGDLETFTDYTYRGVVAMMGGKARMLAYIKNVQATLRRSGITPGTATVGEPLKTVKAGQELHALIPLTMVLNTPKGTLILRSHLIAVSGDKGKTWTFVDTSKWSAKKAKQVFPQFNPALKIPPDTKPKFIPR